MLLWKRYGNNKMAVMRYYGSVFYIFNSTVIDWTLIFIIFNTSIATVQISETGAVLQVIDFRVRNIIIVYLFNDAVTI